MNGREKKRRPPRSGALAAALCAALALQLAACQGPALPEDPDVAVTNPDAAVYYLNPDPALDAQWQSLAAAYTQATGVPVRVVTPEEGAYEEALAAEMPRVEAPTLFSVSGGAEQSHWLDYGWDLTGSEILGLLSVPDLALEREEAVLALPYDLDAAGLLVNLGLLEQTGHGVTELESLSGLLAAAEDIAGRREELGFTAFASPVPGAPGEPGTACLLGSLALGLGDAAADGEEGSPGPSCLKVLWDLLAGSGVCPAGELGRRAPGDDLKEFAEGKAVFCLTGSWAYASLRQAMPEAGLAVLPLVTGVEGRDQFRCLGNARFWCLNRDADLNDLEATLDFLAWCVRSADGQAALAAMGLVLPYQNVPAPEDLFLSATLEDIAGGKAYILCQEDDAWAEGLYSALTAYSAGGSWDAAAAALE